MITLNVQSVLLIVFQQLNNETIEQFYLLTVKGYK